MRSLRSRFVIAGSALVLAAAAGCSSSKSDASSKGGLEKTTIKVSTLPVVNDAPLYIALKQKLFEKEGLKVQAVPVAASAQAIPGLANGSIDVVFGNDSTFFQANDKGALKLKIVAESTTLTSKHMGVLVMPDSPIKTVADLAGKSVAVHILHNIQQITLSAILKANNTDVSKVQYREIHFPDMGAALQKHEVDAIHVVEPWVSTYQKSLGARLVVDGGTEPVTQMPLDGYFATAAWAAKYPKTAAAFQRAVEKAYAIAADRKQVEDVLPTYMKTDPATAKIITLPGYSTSLNAVRLQRLADLMLDEGELKAKLDVNTIMAK